MRNDDITYHHDPNNKGNWLGMKDKKENKMRETRDSKGRVRIDEKHSLDCSYEDKVGFEGRKYVVPTPFIVKSTNDQPIPDDEPRILFRGRDKLAVLMLYHYRDLCIMDECTQFQLDSLGKMIKEFEEFAEKSERMKQPGSTKGA